MVELSPAIASPRGDIEAEEVPCSSKSFRGRRPAAGLEANDVITRIEGQDVETPSDVSKVINCRKPGDRIELTIDRDGDFQTVTATLVERPAES